MNKREGTGSAGERLLNRLYDGEDLTALYAEEIQKAGNVWRWIEGKIENADYDGLRVYDYIPVRIDGNPVKLQIAGIDTYYNAGDERIPHHIDFISKDCYPGTVQYQTTDDNNGTAANPAPWDASNVKKYLNETLYALLPEELRKVIVPKYAYLEERYEEGKKVTDCTGSKWEALGNLWLPSEKEVFGEITNATRAWWNTYYVQYPIFALTGRTRVKMEEEGGTRADWWLLNVNSGDAEQAVIADGYGYDYHSFATRPFSVPICFRIAAKAK